MNDYEEKYPAPMGPGGVELVGQGRTLTKIEAGYQTAISVQKPRKLKEVTDRCLMEADLAGESFYWTWKVFNKRTGKEEIIEGPSIDLAMTVARNYGNCAVPTEVTEIDGEWIFRAAFVDLETGFTFQRVYRKRQVEAPGKYDQDRWDDMQFQAAQSRAQRNVIVKGAPPWLIQQVMDRAKEAALKGIGKMGKETAKTKVLQFFARYQVTKEMLEKLIGENIGKWDEEILLKLRGIARTLQDGQETVESIFGRARSDMEADENSENVKVFYQHLKDKGISRDDKNLKAYIKETADFVREPEYTTMAVLGKAFSEVAGEVDRFILAFRKRYPEVPKERRTRSDKGQPRKGKEELMVDDPALPGAQGDPKEYPPPITWLDEIRDEGIRKSLQILGFTWEQWTQFLKDIGKSELDYRDKFEMEKVGRLLSREVDKMNEAS